MDFFGDNLGENSFCDNEDLETLFEVEGGRIHTSLNL